MKSNKKGSRGAGERLREMLHQGNRQKAASESEAAEPSEKSQLIDALRTLIARTEARSEREERHPEAQQVAIEDVVEGVYEETPHGPIFVVSTMIPLSSWRGSCGAILDEIHREIPPLLARLGHVEQLQGQSLSEFAYFDTETTGLATTSGTYAFMTGLGYVDGSSFRVDQLFMRDYDEEPGYLWLLGQRFAGFNGIVSYNGRAFDVPLIEARFITNRVFEPPIPSHHLDLLPTARRLWRMRGAGCRLTELEMEVLGFEREGDIPGHLIPSVYFDAVRSGNAAPLEAVFYHNREDVVSLACLTAAAAALLMPNERPEHAIGEDFYSAARVLDDYDDQQTEEAYRHALKTGFRSPLVREEALSRLGLHLRRSGDRKAAFGIFSLLAAEGTFFRAFGLIELAKHLEHQQKDHARAVELTQDALSCCEDAANRVMQIPAEFRPTQEAVAHRLARLEARAAGRPWRLGKKSTEVQEKRADADRR
jgi:uncharacterized protein YprB with RNaseH-like and TPR domain